MYYSILNIVSNTDDLYEGNLEHYFKIVFNAPNVEAPYHNFRHMLHVTFEVYDAIKFYGDIDKRRARALLIAALFHDYGHKGVMGEDSENILKARNAVRFYLLKEDEDLLSEIEGLISITAYPLVDCDPSRSAKILRDADMSPAFDDVWFQEIVFGLAEEFKMDQKAFLEQQLKFLPTIKFASEWAQQKFDSRKEERISEIKKLFDIVF